MATMRLGASSRDQGMRSRVIMTFHDAVYVEAPEDDAQDPRAIVTKYGGVIEMPLVPLEVDIE